MLIAAACPARAENLTNDEALAGLQSYACFDAYDIGFPTNEGLSRFRFDVPLKAIIGLDGDRAHIWAQDIIESRDSPSSSTLKIESRYFLAYRAGTHTLIYNTLSYGAYAAPQIPTGVVSGNSLPGQFPGPVETVEFTLRSDCIPPSDDISGLKAAMLEQIMESLAAEFRASNERICCIYPPNVDIVIENFNAEFPDVHTYVPGLDEYWQSRWYFSAAALNQEFPAPKGHLESGYVFYPHRGMKERVLARGIQKRVTVGVQQLQYEPATVKLLGSVIWEDHFGPPNFGENPTTDSKVRVPILVLNTPVDIAAGTDVNASSFSSIEKIQLVIANDETQSLVKTAAGAKRKIAVEGTLFQAHTAHHYTDVLLTVKTITP